MISEKNNLNGISIDGHWNSIKWIKGKPYRDAVETLIIRNNEVYLYFKDDGTTYRIPGGSREKGVDGIVQAQKECEEEARISVKNIIPAEVTSTTIYTEENKPVWQKKLASKGLEYYGKVSEVFIAEYDKKYTGDINFVDSEPDMEKNGKFYKINSIKEKLSPHHLEALKKIDMISINESYSSGKLYHLSSSNLDGKTLHPRVPHNNWVSNKGYEDSATPRVSFSPTIDGALIGICDGLDDKEMYVHEPADYTKIEAKHITTREVPDQEHSKEIWVVTPVKLKCVGKIKVLGRDPNKLKFKMNDKWTHTNGWKWESLKENMMIINEALINPSELKSLEKDDIIKNLDSWKTEKGHNVLYITGISGSGKSTLAREIEEKTGAKIIELDNFEHGYSSSNPIIKEYIKKNPQLSAHFKAHWKDVDMKIFMDEFYKFAKWLLEKLYSDHEQLYILEGIQIYNMFPADITIGQPVIIKKTSVDVADKRIDSRGNDAIFGRHDINRLKKHSKEVDIYTREILKESVIPNITLYHAAPNRYDTLKPLGYDFGNALQDPGWSLFCWKDLESAKAWAIFQSIRSYRKELKQKNMDNPDLRAHWNCYEEKAIMSKEGVVLLKSLKLNIVGYVHEIKVPLNTVGLGNDSTHNEFTTRMDNIKPTKVIEVKLDLSNLDKYIHIMSPEEWKKYDDKGRAGKLIGNRGFMTSYFMTKDYSINFELVRTLEDGLKSGELMPGDNIETYLKSKGKIIKKVSFMDRSKMNLAIKESSILNEKCSPMIIQKGLSFLYRDEEYLIGEIENDALHCTDNNGKNLAISIEHNKIFMDGKEMDMCSSCRRLRPTTDDGKICACGHDHLSAIKIVKESTMLGDNNTEEIDILNIFAGDNNTAGLGEFEWIFNNIEYDGSDILEYIVARCYDFNESLNNISKVSAYLKVKVFLKLAEDISTSSEKAIAKEVLKLMEKEIDFDTVDLTKFDDEGDYNDGIYEAAKVKDKNEIVPVYIVLTSTESVLAKVIKGFTKAPYNHASISFDPSLERMFSFGTDDSGKRGFAQESKSNGYLKNFKDVGVQVHTVFVRQWQKETMEKRVEELIAMKDKLGYSILGLFGFIINQPIIEDTKMFCSQFVDSMFKLINMDLTDKNSAMVTPYDFAKIQRKNIFLVYEGSMKEYNPKKIQRKINNALKKYIPIAEYVFATSISGYLDMLNEYANDYNKLRILYENSLQLFEGELLEDNKKFIGQYFDILYETKEFPVQFDHDGNLLIKKMSNIEYEHEYYNSHKLLLSYEKTESLDGIKYELARLWFMNSILEKKIYDKKTSDEDKTKYTKIRAKILNDFNVYLKFVSKKEPKFNFADYYNNTPFSDATIKINKSTIDASIAIVKSLAKI